MLSKFLIQFSVDGWGCIPSLLFDLRPNYGGGNEDKSEVKLFSLFRLFVTPWTVAYQDPQSFGFSRQEYWSGLPFPSPGIFLTQGSNLGLPHCRQKLYHLSYQGSKGYHKQDWQRLAKYVYDVDFLVNFKNIYLCLKGFFLICFCFLIKNLHSMRK